jgi:hypothetical protein
MTVLGAARDFPLLVHVAGAMVLVGATLTAASALTLARGDTRLLRFGYWTLLAAALPAYIVMRIGAEWIAEREGFNEEGVDEPAWLGIGYAVAEPGGALLLIALILGGIGVYRLRAGKGTGLLKATTVISIVLLAAYVVAAWAMSGKPG